MGEVERVKAGFLCLFRLLLFPGIAGLGLPPASAQSDGTVQRMVREGIEVEFTAIPVTGWKNGAGRLVQGDDVRIAFKVTDTATGTPTTTLEPAGWIHPANPERDCAEKIRAFLSGALGARADIDLNVFYVLAMNEDASLSVVDPLFSFGGSRLLDRVVLKGPGEDWVLSGDQRRLFVTMPTAHQVAVVDTSTWEVVANIDTGPRPVRVELQSDEKYLWIGCDGDDAKDPRSGVTIVDAAKLEKVTHLPTGAGRHDIAFGADDRFAFVTNADGGTLSIVDVWELRVVETIPVGRRPVCVAFSPLSKAVYVVNEEEGTIVVLDGESHRKVTEIVAEPGLGALRFEPSGRLGFVASRRANVVHILDAATHRIVQTGDVGPEPDQVAFTESLAYVRSRGSELVLMIPLDEVGQEGAPVPIVDFSGGQVPFGEAADLSVADGIVPAPGGVAVLVANPVDETIYYYREGMAAPMGSFRNYGRRPRAVLVVDRSLREIEPGVYATDVRLDRSGTLDVPFFLDTPRILHCFSLEVEPDPALASAQAEKGPPLRVATLDEHRLLHTGEEASLRFRVTDPKTGEVVAGLEDLGILAFNSRGWQRRAWAASVGEGIYETTLTPPRSGAYYLSVQCPSRGLRLNHIAPVIFTSKDGMKRGDAK